jgi:signal transduction histidine kinase
MTDSKVEGLTVKAAVLAGFGVTLGLWLLVGYQVTRRMADVEQRSAALNVRYMQAQELLATVRSQVLLGSVYVRDALLDPSPARTREYAEHVSEIYAQVDAALQKYEPLVDSVAERARVERLRREIDEFGAETLNVLRMDSSVGPDGAQAMLRRLMPKREAAIRVSEDVQALNRVAFVQQQAVTGGMHRAIQRQVWTRLSVALGVSFAIALFASTYAGRLERRLRQQRRRDEQNAADLQRLSTSLLDAQREERRRIARELHDEVGQLLSAVKVELTLAEHRMQALTGQRVTLDDAQGIADTALKAVRNLSHVLHPAVLDDLGLVVALRSYTAEFARRHAVALDFTCEGLDGRLPADVEANAYRIVQEALTNVARHAGASTCQVRLKRVRDRLLVTIADDGVGFTVEGGGTAGQPGLGLLSIRERALQLGGTAVVESAPEARTIVTAELPLPASGTFERIEAAPIESTSGTPPVGAIGAAHV